MSFYVLLELFRRTGLLYHTGSLCLGALVNVGLKPLRAVLRIFLLLSRQCKCAAVSKAYRQTLFYSDSAFLAIVLDGPGYVDACEEASRILGNDVEEMTWLDDMLLDVQILGATAISTVISLMVWLCIHLFSDFQNPYSDRLLSFKS